MRRRSKRFLARRCLPTWSIPRQAVRRAPPDHAPSDHAPPLVQTTQPAASVPCGLTAAGLPIGLQVVGSIGADALVLRAARAFEQAQPFPTLDAPRNGTA